MVLSVKIGAIRFMEGPSNKRKRYSEEQLLFMAIFFIRKYLQILGHVLFEEILRQPLRAV